MSLDRVWDFSLRLMNIIGNIVLLQVLNIILLLTGYLTIIIPIIIIVNTMVIYEYLYDNNNYSILNIPSILKKNVTSLLVYVAISFMLLTAINLNLNMQSLVIELNIGFWSELILLIMNVIIGVSTITFMMFFPLVACTTNQGVLTRIKVTFIIPFYSLKAYGLIIVLTILNGLFFFSNALFLILFGPVLLIAINVIIFHVYITKKEEK